MVIVNIGNDHALDADTVGDSVRYRDVSGERTTRIVVPDGLDDSDAAGIVIASMRYHLSAGERPAWIDCQDPGVSSLLAEHYQMGDEAMNHPRQWGDSVSPSQSPTAAFADLIPRQEDDQ